MIEIAGLLFDGNSSKPRSCTLGVDPSGFVHLPADEGAAPVALADISVSERIGNIPRILRFPDGRAFETPDNDRVDQALGRFALSRGSRVLHVLESRWKAIVPAVVLVIVASFSFVQFGIPYFAKEISFALPSKTAASIDQGSLEILDKVFFKKSRLSIPTQSRLRARFNAMVANEDPAFRFQLLFRRGGKIGANALALPSGTIVVTDEMVKISKNDLELVAVLAHEIAHVKERHALRRMFQNSVMLLVVTMLTGDVSSTTGIVAGLPALLIEAQYSQAFEREADAYSLSYLRKQGIDPVHFRNIMLRIEAKYKGDKNIPTFISTHPATEERVKMFNSAGNRGPTERK